MRHRTLFVVSVPIAVLLSVMSAIPAPAQVITDLTFDMATLSEPELLVFLFATAGLALLVRYK